MVVSGIRQWEIWEGCFSAYREGLPMLTFNGLPVVEPVPVEDKICSGLAFIEDMGWGARFVLVSVQRLYEGDQQQICSVKEKIVLPTNAIRPGISMASDFIARKVVRVAGSHLLRLVD